MKEMSVERSQLLEITKTVLTELGITNATNVELTYVEKMKDEWRVSFNYTPPTSWSKSVGCFSVNVESGEITFSALGKVWKLG